MPQSGTITLLFTDLVNSTEHLQREGDEAGDHLFRIHHKLIKEAIEAGGGEELQWLGDGVLAAFSSTADAVRCAIQMQQTARRPASGATFEIRIGIHLGEVLRRDEGYFGTPIVTARRLCDYGSGGQILCSRLIADLLSSRQSFGFRDLGDVKLKGLNSPIGVCEVIYERNDPVAMLNRTPFVGRIAQMKRLKAKLNEAFNGRGAVVMLRGEPGIGKTRTLEEFSDHARQRGAVVLRGACYDGEWQAPYGPFADAITEYAQSVQPTDLMAMLGKQASVLARISPSLKDVIGDLPEPPEVEKDEERFRLFDAVAQVFVAISKQAPLLLILDDLHWAERGTIAMLNHVAHFVNNNRILMIGAYRDAEVTRAHPLSGVLAGLARLRSSETIALKGLHNEELASMLEMIGDEDAPKRLVEALSDATEGNPLFIRELLMHLVEEGKILVDGQGWTSELNVEELGIPEGVRQVIGRRLLRLSEDANRLLTVGSAFNGAFPFEIAAAAAELSEQTALAAIDEAMDAQLLRPGAVSDTFDFTHALIRHTLYSELNSARRPRLHRRIAEEMEHAWGERAASHAAEVAFQFWRASASSGTERGADYAIAAADNAEAAYAHDDVAAFLRIALELLPANDPRRPRLLSRQALAFICTLNGEEAGKAALEAVKGIAASEGAAATADYCEKVAREALRAGLMEVAWELAKAGLRHIGDRRDITWASLDEIDSYRAEGEDPAHPGVNVDSERQRVRRSILKTIPSAQAKARRIDEYPYDSREEILRDPDCDSIALLLLGGECRRSLPIWQQRAADAEHSGRVVLAMDAWAFTARCYATLGDLTAARAAYDRAVALSARVERASLPLLNLLAVRSELIVTIDAGFDSLGPIPGEDELRQNPPPQIKWAYAGACATMAAQLALQGAGDPAIQLLSIVPRALELGAPWGFSYGVTASEAVFTLWLLNRTEYITEIERGIRDKVLAPDFRYPMRDGRLSMARLSALQGRYEEAVNWFSKARAAINEQGWKPLRAITDYDEAIMYARRDAVGDRDRARLLLETAAAQFEVLGMTGWIKRAAAAAPSQTARADAHSESRSF